jgi:hypothetical protein
MPIVGGLDIHRKQITFDYLDTVTGEVKRGQVAPADREHVRGWLARFAGHDDVAFAVEGCAGWRYVSEELAAAGVAAHLGEPAGTAALRGRKRHAKTGKTDARHLRTLLGSYPSRNYCGTIASVKVDKLSVSFDPELGDAVRSAAAEAGKPLSAWLAEAAASKLRAEALAQFLDSWEAEHGVLTADELARAEQELGMTAGDSAA